MHAKITVVPVPPPVVGWSYGDMKFAKYGVCCWEYSGGYWGPVHWINWRNSYFEPEYPRPQKFHYWFYPGFTGTVKVDIDIRDDTANVVVGTAVVNLLAGRGIPVVIP